MIDIRRSSLKNGIVGDVAGTGTGEETGIKNLKVGYNKVFGYYIEVTRSQLSLVPYRYQRKQTLANCNASSRRI